MARRGPKRRNLDLRINRFEGHIMAKACLIARDQLIKSPKFSKEETSLVAMEAADYEIVAKKIIKAIDSLDDERISHWANEVQHQIEEQKQDNATAPSHH